jgi:hypothetical protein
LRGQRFACERYDQIRPFGGPFVSHSASRSLTKCFASNSRRARSMA